MLSRLLLLLYVLNMRLRRGLTTENFSIGMSYGGDATQETHIRSTFSRFIFGDDELLNSINKF